MKKIVLSIFICLVVSLGGKTTSAQEPPPPNMDPAMREKMRAFIVWNLVEYLGLTEDQMVRFFPLFRDYEQVRDKSMNARQQLSEEVSRDIENPSMNIDDIRKKLDRLDSIEKEQLKERQEFMKKSEKVLEERQYLKLRLYDDWMKGNLMRRFRKQSGLDRAGMEKQLEEAEKKYMEIKKFIKEK